MKLVILNLLYQTGDYRLYPVAADYSEELTGGGGC